MGRNYESRLGGELLVAVSRSTWEMLYSALASISRAAFHSVGQPFTEINPDAR